MPKKAVSPKKQNKTELKEFSPKDADILQMETKDVMKKYNMGKQGVYDRRFALNKKLKLSGVSLEQVLNKETKAEPVAEKKKTIKPKKSAPKKITAPIEESKPENREVMVVNKHVPIVPVIMKPIEINFDNFSIKLNGVPKKISVNPDTNAIEIDL